MVGRVNRELKEGSSVDLPGIGRLYMEADDLLRFVTDAEFERLLRSFGHASIALSPKEQSDPSPAKLVAFPAQDSPAPETDGSWRIQLGRAAAAVAADINANAALQALDYSATADASNPGDIIIFRANTPITQAYVAAATKPRFEQHAVQRGTNNSADLLNDII